LVPEYVLLDGLELLPLELPDGLELMLPPLEPELMPLDEVEPDPLCSFFSWALHSEREICPSWFVSMRSNSLEPDEDEDVPPEAELGLEDEELVPPAEDDEGEDDLLLCDMDGEVLELDEFFDESAA
jgi:hypothetical protein